MWTSFKFIHKKLYENMIFYVKIAMYNIKKDVKMKKVKEIEEIQETVEKVKKIYKEPNKCEEETTINLLYGEKNMSIYTNKVDLQRQLYKIFGEPSKEYIKGRSIMGSVWNVPLSEKTRISKMLLKANIFEL